MTDREQQLTTALERLLFFCGTVSGRSKTFNVAISLAETAISPKKLRAGRWEHGEENCE